MKRLVLIGASGIALEIIDAVFEINARAPIWDLIGIIDDDKSKRGTIFYRDIKILGDSSIIEKFIDDNTCFLISFCSVGNFLLREEYIKTLIKKYPGIQFANVIHPSVFISPSASIGEGLFLAPNVVISSKSSIGSHSIILFNSVIGRLVTLGDYCFLSASVNIMGNITIGKNNYIGVKSTITKSIKDNNFINTGALVHKTVEGNSIIYSQGSTITECKSREELYSMLRSF